MGERELPMLDAGDGVRTWPCEKHQTVVPEFLGITTGDFTGYAEHWSCPVCGDNWIVQVPQ